MPNMYALMTDKDRALLLGKWLETYFEMLGQDPKTRLDQVDKIVGITDESRRKWFKEEFGQKVLAEFKTDLDQYSATRLTLRRHAYLDNMMEIAVGRKERAPAIAQVTAARFLEEVYQAAQTKGEDAPVGKVIAILNLYQGKTASTRPEEDPVEGEVRVLEVGPEA